jgi:hypothetical protein
MVVEIPIWFPEASEGDPVVEAFWRTFRKGPINLLTTNPAAAEAFDRAVGLRVRIGDHELKAGKGIEWFLAMPYQTPDPKTEQFLSDLLKSMHIPERPLQQLDEPGFCRLLLGFQNDGSIVRNRTPVMISYRQPLARSRGAARLFYMPVFDNLPQGFVTSDTNRYSIAFVARGCSVAITNGTQFGHLGSGGLATFAPQLRQPFRAESVQSPIAL